MSISFVGGPLDGQSAPDPAMPEEPAQESAADLFKSTLANVRALLSSPDFNEQQRMELSKAESLLQKIKAQEEKEQEQAMSGKLSPGILRKIGGGQ